MNGSTLPAYVCRLRTMFSANRCAGKWTFELDRDYVRQVEDRGRSWGLWVVEEFCSAFREARIISAAFGGQGGSHSWRRSQREFLEWVAAVDLRRHDCIGGECRFDLTMAIVDDDGLVRKAVIPDAVELMLGIEPEPD